MFDIGWSEMAMVALIALVIMGPKELPKAMRNFAHFTRKMRRYAQDFRAGVDNIVREAELEEARDTLNKARSLNPRKALEDFVDPTGETTEEIKAFEKSAREDAKAIKQSFKEQAGMDEKKIASDDEEPSIGDGEPEKKKTDESRGDDAADETPDDKKSGEQSIGKPAAIGATAASTAAGASSSEAASGDKAEENEGPKARLVKQPLAIAPGSSLRPPVGEDPYGLSPSSTSKTEESAAEPEAPADRAGKEKEPAETARSDDAPKEKSQAT